MLFDEANGLQHYTLSLVFILVSPVKWITCLHAELYGTSDLCVFYPLCYMVQVSPFYATVKRPVPSPQNTM